MDSSPKVFSVEEANQLLGQVAPLLQQLQGLQQSIARTNQELDEAVGKLSQGNGYPVKEIQQRVSELTQHQLNLIEAFQSALQQLENLGCLLKDLNTGLVDFYSMRSGELVFLCWKVGEEMIQFWHGLEDGFSGRQPL